jgi:hypothetical protein
MRIESQGKYLQTVLEKAQMSLSQDEQGNLEASKAQLAEFNSALSNFMENMNKDSKENIVDINGFYNKNYSSAFNYQEVIETEENKDLKPQVEGGSVQLDLNIKGGNELLSTNEAEMDSKMVSYRVYHF